MMNSLKEKGQKYFSTLSYAIWQRGLKKSTLDATWGGMLILFRIQPNLPNDDYCKRLAKLVAFGVVAISCVAGGMFYTNYKRKIEEQQRYEEWKERVNEMGVKRINKIGVDR